MSANSARELQKIYGARFAQNLAYRRKVWNVLVPSFFQKYVALGDAVLDLGCGYGEFINTIRCGQKFAMDLNPDAPKYLDSSDRKSTRLNSSHLVISYAVFCLKKK